LVINRQNKTEQILTPDAKFKTNKNGYQRMFRSANKELFGYLDRLGFFDFHITNSGRCSAYVHQAAMYLRNTNGGWEQYKFHGRFAAQGELEVHHLDGSTCNNESDNLSYVTPAENKMLALLCRGHYYGKAKLLATAEQFRTCAAFVALEFETQSRTLARIARESFNIFQEVVDVVADVMAPIFSYRAHAAATVVDVMAPILGYRSRNPINQ